MWRRALFGLVWGAGFGLDLAGRAVTHVAAGMLTAADLRATIRDGWEHFGRDEGDVLSGLRAWEQDWYERFLRPEDRILLVGCGTGRDLIALLRRGYRVEGLDPAAGAVTVARRMLDRVGLSTELHVGGVEEFAPPGAFDVFAFSWLCYSYLPQSRSRVDVLRRLADHLRPAGRILVSYVPTDRQRRLPISLIRLGSRLTRSDWRAEPGDRIAVSAPRRQTVHFQHEFMEGEIESEAKAAGLRVVFHARTAEGLAVLTE